MENSNVLDNILEPGSKGVETVTEVYEAIKESKAIWHVKNNDIWQYTAKFTHDKTIKIRDFFGIKANEKYLESDFLGFDLPQNILFNKAKIENKEQLLEYIKENYNTNSNNIKRNLNIYWLERISKLFESYEKDAKYNTNGYFNKALYEQDKLKIQKVCCDMLFGGSNKDYENVKQLAKAIKQKKTIDYLTRFSKDNTDYPNNDKESAFKETKLGELLTNYIAIQEPTRTLVVVTLIVGIGAFHAFSLPASIGFIAAASFILKVNAVTKTIVKLQDKFVKYEGSDKYDPFYNLNRHPSEYNGTNVDILNVVIASKIKNELLNKKEEINDIKLKMDLGLSDDDLLIVKGVSKLSEQQKLDFCSMRNPDLRILFIRAANESENVEVLLSTIKNLDSLLTVRSMEDNCFKAFNLKNAIFDENNKIRDIPLSEIIQGCYYESYSQANLLSLKTEKMLFDKSYTNDLFDVAKFNNLIVEECTDLISNVNFTKLISRGIQYLDTILNNNVFKKNKGYEVTTVNHNESLSELIKKINPQQYFTESVREVEVNSVNNVKSDFKIDEKNLVDSKIKNRVDNLLTKFRKNDIKNENKEINKI